MEREGERAYTKCGNSHLWKRHKHKVAVCRFQNGRSESAEERIIFEQKIYCFILFVLTRLTATPNMNLVYDLALSRPSVYVTFALLFQQNVIFSLF
jgi:hypothetical protein